MSKVIVWEKPDGGVAVTYPVWSAKKAGDTDEQFLAKLKIASQQPGFVHKFNIESSSLPTSGKFFDQWRINGGAVTEDIIEMGREKWRRIKLKRNKLLIDSDHQKLKMTDLAQDSTALDAYRKKLRDIPTDFPDPDNVVYPAKPF